MKMKTKTEKRRHYERPRTRVVELQQAAHMMQTSGRRQGYGTAVEEEWT